VLTGSGALRSTFIVYLSASALFNWTLTKKRKAALSAEAN
jgi:hypothetical protein